MELEQFEQIMEADYDYNDRIKDGLIKGILLMRKFCHSADIEGADHDIIYSIDCQQLIDAGIVQEDVMRLRLMGWHIQDEYLCMFV